MKQVVIALTLVLTSYVALGAWVGGEKQASVITQDQVGATNGVASLDSAGQVPTAELPSIALAGGTNVYDELYLRSGTNLLKMQLVSTNLTITRGGSTNVRYVAIPNN